MGRKKIWNEIIIIVIFTPINISRLSKLININGGGCVEFMGNGKYKKSLK